MQAFWVCEQILTAGAAAFYLFILGSCSLRSCVKPFRIQLLYHPMLNRIHRQLYRTTEVEFLHDILLVCVHRVRT